MAIIQGTLTNGGGEIINNCIIELYAKKTTSKVLSQTQSFTVTKDGFYFINAHPCEYVVSLIISGFPKKTLGSINIYSDSKDGTLNARKANISGKITANEGDLNNVVISENCEIKGKLTAMQIVGDIVKNVYFQTGSTITIDPEPFNRMICTSQLFVASFYKTNAANSASGYRIYINNSPIPEFSLRATSTDEFRDTDIDQGCFYYLLPANKSITIKSKGVGYVYPKSIVLSIFKS